MEPTPESTSNPSTPEGERLRFLLTSNPPPAESEIQFVMEAVTIDTLPELDTGEQKGLLEIINEITLNPDHNEQVAPRAPVNDTDTNFIEAKPVEIYHPTEQLPESPYSLRGLDKSKDIPFASGGTTEIWRGTWNGDNKKVAFKVFRIPPNGSLPIKKAIWKRASVWKNLGHENVLPFYGVETSIFEVALVYEWAENGNIVEYLKSNPDALRSELLLQVAKGLQYLHSLDISHGNLKGTNVLISAAGIAQICDYGLDPVISLPDVQVNVTPGSVTCSHWIAPEFIGSNPKQKTKSADVFAFAMLAVEVYTGELPFKVTPASFACIMIFHGHRPGRPQAKPFGFTEGMWKFIQRCWNQEPIERPSIDEVVNTWEGFVKGTCDASVSSAKSRFWPCFSLL